MTTPNIPDHLLLNPLNFTDEELGDLCAWLSWQDTSSVKPYALRIALMVRGALERDGYL